MRRSPTASPARIGLAVVMALVPAVLGAQQLVVNTATANYLTTLGLDSAVSNVVQTTILRPDIALQNTLTTAASARSGDTVRVHITYGNAATAGALTAATLTDTVPNGLQLAGTQPAATVTGSVLQWTLGTLGAGSSGEAFITFVVAAGLHDTVQVHNAAVLSAANLAPQAAVSAPVELIGTAVGAIALSQSADMLQVSLGQVAPFTITVTNSGTTPITHLVIRDSLPDGAAYVNGSAVGADSAGALGRLVTFRLTGSLAAGTTRTVHYRAAIVAARSTTLQNVAYATADQLAGRTPDAVALLQVLTTMPMEDRAVIGKVWVDANNNGVEDAGESGLAGLDIWTDDGDIASTDADGRFSFRNIRPGEHSYRLDAASIPAGYRLADDGATRGAVTRDGNGWTTPHVDFRLVPTTGRIVAIRLTGLADTAVAGGPHPDARDHSHAASTALTAIPDPTTLSCTCELIVELAPPAAGWTREASFVLPPGWAAAADSVAGIAKPALLRDRNGARVIVWPLTARRTAPIVITLRTASAAAAVDPVRVPALRTAADRAADRSREFLDGPGIEITTPQDGAVSASDRIYVGVRGEPGAPVALFDGDSLIARATIRIDGLQDFIGVALVAGDHRLRARVTNSWSHERWDSLTVHVTARPASFAAEHAPVRLIADGQTTVAVRVRVLDAFGVPVTNRPPVTVAATGAAPINPDADPSSVGVQILPDAAGWLEIELRPGKVVMHGTLRLSHADIHADVPLVILPATQPLQLTAVGRVGIGASPDAFGSMTLRGRLDDQTSVVMSYDTRQLDAGVDAFGRTADPLAEAQYPLLGDASAERTSSAAQYQIAGKIQRGFDWLTVGDIPTAGFGSDLRLSDYRRAVPGIAARVSTGAVTWQAFGSSTSQVLQQLQLRGAGVSGPYQLSGTIRQGTEQVTLEERAVDNTARVIDRQVLVRYVDYQIDYDAGTLLFKQPVPAVDAYGQPVFIVVLYEAESGGPKSDLWGVRAALDGNRLINHRLADSVRLGATWVHESPASGDHQLLGTDFHLAHVGAFELGGETSWSSSRDSSGFAAAADGSVALLHGAAHLSASWLAVGRTFGNPSDAALLGGTSEIRFAAHYQTPTREYKIEQAWQSFDAEGVDRSQTTGTVVQSLGHAVQVEGTLASDRFDGGTAPTASAGGVLKIHFKPERRWTLTTEARHEFMTEGPDLEPDYIGAGAAYDLTHAVSLNLDERRVFLPGDSGGYSVTDLGVRTRVLAGTEAYGTYQIAGVDGATNAALVGLKNSMHLGQSWALNALFERRTGLDRTSVFDPVRALPFVQTEEDYWSAGLGAEYVRPTSPYRFSARGEWRDGSVQSTRLLTVAGDVSLNRSLAILSRQELLRSDEVASGVTTHTHNYSTLWGVAYRPVNSDAINVLAKFEGIDALNPAGLNVLNSPGDEGRTIVATEIIWQPASRLEVGARFALRRTTGLLSNADSTTTPLESSADFVGWRAGIRVLPLVELRADARLLAEQVSATNRADIAPQLVFLPQKMVEVAFGYRVGDLRDPDFAVTGGPGWFVTLGAQLTEATVRSAADFWRGRLAGGQQ